MSTPLGDERASAPPVWGEEVGRRVFRTLRAWMTMRPAMIAFVVAIAGMMFPAISGHEPAIKTKLNNGINVY